jgi:hypothetical protein
LDPQAEISGKNCEDHEGRDEQDDQAQQQQSTAFEEHTRFGL